MAWDELLKSVSWHKLALVAAVAIVTVVSLYGVSHTSGPVQGASGDVFLHRGIDGTCAMDFSIHVGDMNQEGSNMSFYASSEECFYLRHLIDANIAGRASVGQNIKDSRK